MEDSTRNPNAPGSQTPTPNQPGRKLTSTQQAALEWQHLRAQIRSLSDSKRSEFLIFLTGFFANPSSVTPTAVEFWQRVSAACEELHQTQPLDGDAILRKMDQRAKRFNELLAGPLHHPVVPFVISRMSLALFTVAISSDEAWQVLEEHCRQRDRRDGEDAEEVGNVSIC